MRKTTRTASLYERLGGTEGITTIASDLIDIHIANPRIAPRHANSDIAKVKNGAAYFSDPLMVK